MINIGDVARKAGVSPATVSRVINNTSPVREETRDRVLKAIKDCNYMPNVAARNLSTQNSLNNIGLVIPDADNPFFLSILRGVTLTADQYHYNTLLFNTDENPNREHRFLKTVLDQNLKGIIIIPLSERDEETQASLMELESVGVPVVLVDRRIGDLDFDGIYSDDEKDAFQAVEALIAAGHTRIATIAGPQRSTPGMARLLGYQRAMESHGLSIPPEYIAYGDFKFDGSRAAAEQLLSLDNPPTAIFTANVFSTLGLLACLSDRGLQIGKDISLIGFDAVPPWLHVLTRPGQSVGLSLVERPEEQMAREAVELLQSRIRDGQYRDSARKRLILSNRLVLRGSETMPALLHPQGDRI